MTLKILGQEANKTWVSSGVAKKPKECYQYCQYASIGSGFTPDYYPENPKIAVLLESPGEQEILERTPLVGKAGKLWIKLLIEKLGYQREDVLISNVGRCKHVDNLYPTGEMRIKMEKACRQWDSYSGVNGELVKRGILHFAPTICIIAYHPAAILRTPALYRPTLRSMELAFKFAERGERPVVAMGDTAMSLLAPALIGKGGLKVWNRTYFKMDGWPFNKVVKEKLHEIPKLN